MRNISSALLAQFEVGLRERAVPNNAHGSYKKWLRFYLDFCEKYHFPESRRESLTHFLHKLEDKRQTEAQQLEASQAIALYDQLIDSMAPHDEIGSPQKVISPGKLPIHPVHLSTRLPTPKRLPLRGKLPRNHLFRSSLPLRAAR